MSSLLIPAFIAGVLTFLAPCTLPLVPAFLSFIGGVSSAGSSGRVAVDRPRVKIFVNALFFVFGFSLIFIVTGTLVGFVGSELLGFSRTWLERIGGVFVVLSGLAIVGFFHFPARFNFGRPGFSIEPGRPVHSFFLGAAFSFGWTPCVGPVLGSILFLSSASHTALEGGFLLLIFSAGLALPFLLTAFFLETFLRHVKKIAAISRMLSLVGGIFMVMLGVLLIFGKAGLLASYGYQLFETLGYNRLLDYL